MAKFGARRFVEVLALSSVLSVLSGCGGSGSNPRDEAGGTGGMPATGGAGGTTGGTSGTAGMGGAGTSGTAGAPAEECSMPMDWTGGSIAVVEMDGDRIDSGRGGWFFFHAGETDGCPTCVANPETPTGTDPPVVVLEETDPPRTGSTKALHWSGSGWVEAATYGAGMGIYIDNCANMPPDVTGISFFYRSDIALSFGSTQASIDYGTDVPAATDWTEAQIPFTDMLPASGSSELNQTKIGGFFWRVGEPAGGTFDVWLDDIAWIGGS